MEAAKDLVLFTVPGVQRFISESRTTSDLASASSQVASLVSVVVESVGRVGEVVFPAVVASDDAAGVPNRVVARVAAGAGEEVAGAASRAVADTWRAWVVAVFGPAQVPDTPGFPDPQWVVVPSRASGGRVLTYREQFQAGQRALAARRRVRSFEQLDPTVANGRELCSLAPRWFAVDPPPQTPRHQATERLSAVGWVKRRAPQRPDRPRVPSMLSIATAPFRAEVLARLGEAEIARSLMALHRAAGVLTSREAPVPGLRPVPGTPAGLMAGARWLAEVAGGWVHPDRWTDQAVAEYVQETTPGSDLPVDVRGARQAARDLSRALGRVPGTHVAVVSQDIDSLGRFLGQRADVAGHRDLSRRLGDLAGAQLAVMGDADGRRFHAVPVYAGGDDVLLLAPAATAVPLAEAMHASVVEAFGGDGLTASTGVMFASAVSSLQQAVAGAHRLLGRAKGLPGKHGLAVGYERRSGSTHATVQPWVAADGESTVARLGAVSGVGGVRLSPRLAFDLQRDRDELDRLGGTHPDLLRAEIDRLVRRHVRAADGGRAADAEVAALAGLVVDLGRREGGRQTGFDPVPAAMVAVFMRGECR